MNEILNRDAVDLAAMIARREISAAELMEATLARIDEVNPKLNAIVAQIDFDAAMDLARAADRGPVKGPMHGLPLAIKDLADAKGLPTSMGSPVYKDAGPAPKDDIMVARMRAAGALQWRHRANVPRQSVWRSLAGFLLLATVVIHAKRGA